MSRPALCQGLLSSADIPELSSRTTTLQARAESMTNRPGSVASRGSTLSKYHTVCKTSQVDEALFGSAKPGSKAKSKAQNVATFDSSVGSKAPEVVALSKGQLTKMMGPSPILTAAQSQELKKAAQEAKDKEREVSKARKARMLAMEEERKKQARSPYTCTCTFCLAPLTGLLKARKAR